MPASKKPQYKQKRMRGQDPRNEAMYRFGKNGRMAPSDFKISKDIDKRDRKDIDAGRKRGASKLTKMAAKDAVARQNRLGWAEEGSNMVDTGRGYTRKEGAAMTKRLKKWYPKAAKKKK